MAVAVMQPYLFPYLGYYQLAYCADTFVLYDDVTFIKGGWINRNNILSPQGAPMRLTVPVLGASPNVPIKDLNFSDDVNKILRTIKQAYGKAPFFEAVYPLVEKVLTCPERDITAICQLGIEYVFDYLGLNKTILRSSEITYDRSLPAADRLVSICRTLDSSDYVNSIGGQKLYSKYYFEGYGCSLSFLQMNDIQYPQGRHEFVPNLSMIDVLMWCDKHHAIRLLQQYTLI